MIENIAIWGGVAGLIVSLFAIIILFLTKQNINNILNKDAILFNESFTTKKDAIASAMGVADELIETQNAIKTNPDFIKNAKSVYNNLLCVLSDVRIADEFYDIVLDSSVLAGEARLTQLKLMLRSDIGLKSKNSKAIKRVINAQKNANTQPMQQFQASVQQAPIQQSIAQPTQPVQNTATQPAQQNIMQSTQPISQPNYVQPATRPMAQPVRPTRPTAPAGTQPRPVAPRPATQPVRRPVPPKDEE